MSPESCANAATSASVTVRSKDAVSPTLMSFIERSFASITISGRGGAGEHRLAEVADVLGIHYFVHSKGHAETFLQLRDQKQVVHGIPVRDVLGRHLVLHAAGRDLEHFFDDLLEGFHIVSS